MKACLLLFFYFSFICQLHGADVKIKQNESMMGSFYQIQIQHYQNIII